jgi:hypothetical protein
MPFTLAHPAAVVLFRRMNLVWSAVIIGSMAPDFPYLVGSPDYRALGHRWPGILEFTLPAALATVWVFHHVIKRPVIGLLPISLQRRLQSYNRDFPFGPARRFGTILLSTVLGILTHLVWDSFTHAYSWPWYHMHWLRGWSRVPGFGWTPRYYMLQYGSTFLGLLVIGVWCYAWYRKTEPVREANSRQKLVSRLPLAIAMFVVAGLAGLLRAYLTIGVPHTWAKADLFVLMFGVTVLAFAFWQLLLYCVLVSSHQVWTMP